MRSTKSLNFILFIIFIAMLALFGGSPAMSNQVIEIKWEWLAGRTIETKLLIDVTKISKVSKGVFGIGASPSIADTLPDATDVVASVVSGSERLIGKSISLRIPGVEANKLKVGEHAALALVNSNTICVCVSAVPTNTQEIESWLNKWDCK